MSARTAYPAVAGMKFSAETQLVVVHCPTCHIAHAIPESLQQSAKAYRGADGWQIHCPLGHSWHYVGETDLQRAERLLERERQDAAFLASRLDQVKADRDQTRRSLAATRGVLTKTKRRVGNGVCPCCNRTFQQLARHMHAKHPDYADGDS